MGFLDKLVTNDLEGMAHGEARYTALLSPQGKVLFEFIAVGLAGDDVVLIDVARDAAPELVKRLTLYRLRAKIEIADLSADFGVACLQTGAGGAPHGASPLAEYIDPRDPALGRRAIMRKGDLPPDNGEDDYDALRISLRVPEAGRDYALGEIVPHEALLDRLHGVSFSKGCYVGQEIVARMEHRGTARKRFVRVASDAPLPPMGTEIRAGEALAGLMGSSCGGRTTAGEASCRYMGLALLRLDRLADFEAKGVALTSGGVGVTPHAADVTDLMPKAPDPVGLD